MIGHVFASSGATILMLAPSYDRPDEYRVLARTENGYAVADLLTESLGEIGGPQYWLRAGYYDRHNDAHDPDNSEDLTEAVEQIAKDVGREDVGTLRAHAVHAQGVVEHRQHLSSQG